MGFYMRLALTARHVRHGVRSQPHLPFARYQRRTRPRRFSNNSPPSLFSRPSLFTFLHLTPGRASGRAELHLLPTASPLPQNRYEAASGKNAVARPAGSYSLDASAVLSPRPSNLCVNP
jgi:hypothetical protein